MAEGDREDPDLELVERWLKGGRERKDAEGDIFRRFSPQLKHLFQKWGYWPEEVEDLKQKTFQRVFKSIETFKGTGRFSSWVLRIAENVRRSNARSEILDNRIPKVSIDTLPYDISTAEPNPERVVISRERLNKVEAAMDQLSKQERRCVGLRVQGYTYEEIAMIMGIEKSTCRAHVHNARKHLRDILGDLLPEDGF
jgi:RNA polymerase sigma-70 factor, ECF subfamily